MAKSEEEDDGGLSGGAIAGIVIACVVVVALAIAIPCIVSNNKPKGPDSVEYETPEDEKQEINLRSVSVL